MKKILGYNKWLNESHKSFGYDPDDWKEMTEILANIEEESRYTESRYLYKEIGKLIPIEDKNSEKTIEMIIEIIEKEGSVGEGVYSLVKNALNLRYNWNKWEYKLFDENRWNRVK